LIIWKPTTSLWKRSGCPKSEALGIGYAPKGMMKGYVAIPIRLPTGELTGYIGITEAKLPKEFHLSNVVTFPKKPA
jgi:hypothetical protein